MLADARASVQTQAVPLEHLVLVDTEYQGCAKTVNQLAAQAKGRWLFTLADDDLLHPGCLTAHLAASEGVDVVYSPPQVEGEPDEPFHGDLPGIPSTALISANLWRWLGGYDEERDHCEDLDFFTRALEAGAVFRRVPGPLWTYRFHGANKSRGQMVRRAA